MIFISTKSKYFTETVKSPFKLYFLNNFWKKLLYYFFRMWRTWNRKVIKTIQTKTKVTQKMKRKWISIWRYAVLFYKQQPISYWADIKLCNFSQATPVGPRQLWALANGRSIMRRKTWKSNLSRSPAECCCHQMLREL